MFVFFILPATALGIQKALGNKNEVVLEAEADESELEAIESEIEESEFLID